MDKRATRLRLTQFGQGGFWKALVKQVRPQERPADTRSAERQVLDWINSKPLQVLYTMVSVEEYGDRIPELVRGAIGRLGELARFSPGTRLVVLFGCIRRERRWALWWPRPCPPSRPSGGCCGAGCAGGWC